MLRTAFALILVATPGLADITVTDARLVAAFPNARAAAIYATVESDAPDMLIGAHSDAPMTQIHETIDDGGVMKMQEAGELPIGPDASITFETGGLHVMVMGLTPDMLETSEIPITLIFRDAGEVTVDAPVTIRGEEDARSMMHGDAEHGHGDHGDGKTE
jgi:copper(I)-binding protein